MENQAKPRPDNSNGAVRRSLKDIMSVYGPALILALGGFIIAYQFVEPAPPKHLVMATGPQDGAYHLLGLKYQQILARYDVNLELRNTAGSVENLDLLQQPDGPVDIAFMQGGIGKERDTGKLTSVASLFHEPLWIFRYKNTNASELLRDLKGLKVAIDEPGSGTYAAITRLIQENDIPQGEIKPILVGGEAAADALLAGDVDVACFVSSYDAPYIQRLLTTDGIQLSSFARAEAYKRRHRFLSSVVLPRGAANLEADIPPTDITMLAPIANLAARQGLHPTLVILLVEAAREIHSPGDMFGEQGEFPSIYNTTFPINKHARKYDENGPPLLQRFLPFWIAVAIDRLVILLIPLATLLLPLFKILPPTYRWRVRSRIYKHYRYLFEIENLLQDNPSATQLDECNAQIGTIEDELRNIEIPLGYGGQLYQLRTHVRFVKQRVDNASLVKL